MGGKPCWTDRQYFDRPQSPNNSDSGSSEVGRTAESSKDLTPNKSDSGAEFVEIEAPERDAYVRYASVPATTISANSARNQGWERVREAQYSTAARATKFVTKMPIIRRNAAAYAS